MDAVQTCDGDLLPRASARKLCRRMFLCGFALLPWMWIANIWLFWTDFRGHGDDLVIQKYTRQGLVGFIIVTSVFLSWFVAFQVDGQNLLGKRLYRAFDATSLDIDMQ